MSTGMRPVRVAVIGAGMSGILSAIKLREAGITDITVYEKAERFGGTWRENTYPGLSCDVPSHLYSYSFAPSADWSQCYAAGPEILAYFERVAGEHDVGSITRFGDAVVSLEWRDERWHLDTERGHHDEVDIVIAATGVLHHPNVPAIDGLDQFTGAAFHSARWDHDVPLDGRRIGVIGTGSTAVQITSALVARAADYTLFQRTAQWVMPVVNPAYSEDERAQWRDSPETMQEIRARFAERFARMTRAVIDPDSPEYAMIEAGCRANLDTVRDPELRARLTPDYRAACKRLIASPDFYDAIQQPNAHLVAEAITRVEPAGVRTADGALHELDVLVLATGFRADSFLRPMQVTGIDGITLDHEWHDRPSAYLSVAVAGFPNLFMLNGPNGPVGNFSLIEVAELQLAYVMQLIERIRRGECRSVVPTSTAMETFEADRTEAARHTIWASGCNSWYLDDRGVPASWPWPFERFREVMRGPDLSAYALV